MLVNDDLRRRAEALFLEKAAPDAKPVEGALSDAAKQVLHELSVHQIELEMQNEELLRIQLELVTAKARYFDLYDLAPVGYCTVNEAGLIEEVNLTAVNLLGVNRSVLLKRPFSHFILKGDEDIFHLMQKQLIKTGEPQSCELRMVKQRIEFWAHLAATVTHEVGTARVLKIVLSDISKNKEAANEIHRLAYFDTLTHLPNRRMLQDRLGQVAAAASRKGLYGAILFLDLDNFKTINDTRGHQAGDRLLAEVARRLRRLVREGDTLARLGGDEFVVLLEDLGARAEEAAAQAKQVAEKILLGLAEPYSFNDFDFHCTVSIGVGLYNEHSSVDELLRHADLAMYQAKSAGRNTLRFFDPAMQASVTARAAMEEDLRNALERDEFKLYFQAQMNSQHQIVGAEVLLRWLHPLRGMVSPLAFIPLAEKNGQILAIGLWVLETACAQLKAWEKNPRARHLQVAINVSARQLFQTDFVDNVMSVLKRHAINPERIKLEITESMLLDNIDETIVKMNALRELGVRFSMDDFGTGFSSLSSLTKLPLQQLKIDQSFVRNVGVTAADATIVQTIIGMAGSLGIEVIAEGVETEQQRAFLEQHGCPSYQGYLFSRPLPIEEFEQLLAV